jgi:disulfide bond formation protein DsbB
MTDLVRRLTTPGMLLSGMALASLAAVGAALYGQHVQGMLPCPWCILQRLIFLLIAALALLALFARGRWRLGFTAAVAGVVLAAGCGVAAALYQNLVAAHMPSCDMTLADRIVTGLGVDSWLPEVFEVRASCADAAVKLFGVPYELLSCALFAGIGAAALLLLKRHRPQR